MWANKNCPEINILSGPTRYLYIHIQCNVHCMLTFYRVHSVVIDCAPISFLDAVGVNALKQLVLDFYKCDVQVLFACMTSKTCTTVHTCSSCDLCTCVIYCMLCNSNRIVLHYVHVHVHLPCLFYCFGVAGVCWWWSGEWSLKPLVFWCNLCIYRGGVLDKLCIFPADESYKLKTAVQVLLLVWSHQIPFSACMWVYMYMCVSSSLPPIPLLQKRTGTWWTVPSSMRCVGRNGCSRPYKMPSIMPASVAPW